MKITNQGDLVRSPQKGLFAKLKDKCKEIIIVCVALVSILLSKCYKLVVHIKDFVYDLPSTLQVILFVAILVFVCVPSNKSSNDVVDLTSTRNPLKAQMVSKDAEPTKVTQVIDRHQSEPNDVAPILEPEVKNDEDYEKVVKEINEGLWATGASRKELLQAAGFDPDKVQQMVNERFSKPKPSSDTTYKGGTSTNQSGYQPTDGRLTKSGGVSFNNPLGLKETWYSQRVLSGGGLKIPGRHVDDRGFVRDGDGYICLAINNQYYPKGTVVQTSNGAGKVYDNCPSFYNGKPVIDVYVDW